MEEELFDQVGQALSQKKRSSMFGVDCYRCGRKPFILLYEQQIVCKLYGPERETALNVKGASLFRPIKDAKPMNNWVQLPYEQADKWELYAQIAFDFVSAE